jgi:hypothetical protein
MCNYDNWKLQTPDDNGHFENPKTVECEVCLKLHDEKGCLFLSLETNTDHYICDDCYDLWLSFAGTFDNFKKSINKLLTKIKKQ